MKLNTIKDAKIRFDSFTERRFNIIGVFPAVLILAVVVAYPLLSLIYLSFTNTNAFNLLSGTQSFVGLDNFVNLFRDSIFLKSVFNTFYFTIVSTGLQFLLGLLLALMVYPMSKRSKNAIVTLLLVPAMIADVAVGLLWSSLLNISTGVINYLVRLFGFDSIAFLGESKLAMLTIIIIAVWQWFPYMFLFTLAGLESLSVHYIEVAKLEGCNAFQSLYYVTLPLISPVLFVALFFRITSSIRVFDKIFVLTGGGPGSATETISTYIQRLGFVNLKFGFASAGGFIMLLIAMLIGLISLKFMYGSNKTSLKRGKI